MMVFSLRHRKAAVRHWMALRPAQPRPQRAQPPGKSSRRFTGDERRAFDMACGDAGSIAAPTVIQGAQLPAWHPVVHTQSRVVQDMGVLRIDTHDQVRILPQAQLCPDHAQIWREAATRQGDPFLESHIPTTDVITGPTRGEEDVCIATSRGFVESVKPRGRGMFVDGEDTAPYYDRRRISLCKGGHNTFDPIRESPRIVIDKRQVVGLGVTYAGVTGMTETKARFENDPDSTMAPCEVVGDLLSPIR